MIRSMTGYGAAETRLSDGRIVRAEVRTVNHRHLSVSARLPRGWEHLEAAATTQLRSVLARGRVTLSVACEMPVGDDPGAPELDRERVRRQVAALRQAGEELGVAGRLDLVSLAGLPGVWQSGGAGANPPDEDALHECLMAALRDLVAMREAEGRRLEAELRSALAGIAAELELVEERAPVRLIRERDRLRERVAVLADGVDVDEERLAREIAHLADKWDISEEIVRLKSHIAFFAEHLGGDDPLGAEGGPDHGAGAAKQPTATGPAGKRLGFVVQEMNREANTLGSKANDARISASAVAVKEELERIREQLENVE